MSLDTCAGKATVTQLCRVFRISRAAYYAAQQRPAEVPRQRAGRGGRPPAVSAERLEAGIRRVVAEHPAWGIRKVWATLRREQWRVTLRRVAAMMKALGLTLAPDRERGEPRRSGSVVVPEANRRWSSDLTTVWTRLDGVVAVVPVVDCGCRTVLATGVSIAQSSPAVLDPLQRALCAEFGSAEHVPDGLELRTDHGPQFTGGDCAELCDAWGLEHTMAPVGRPTGNAVSERVIRTLKEECLWLQDFDTAVQVAQAVEAWRRVYNERRPHQALDWKTPSERRAELLGHPLAEAA